MYRDDNGDEGGDGGGGISIFRYGIPSHSPRGSHVPPDSLPRRTSGAVSSQTVPAKGPPPQVEGCPLDALETKPTIGGSWDGRDGSLIYVRPRTLHNHLELVTRGPRPRRAVKIRKEKKRKDRGVREGDGHASPGQRGSHRARNFLGDSVSFDR